MLIARRAEDKHPFPGTWVCAVGGKAEESESFHDAALREMKEEIGVVEPVRRVASFKYDGEFRAEFAIFTTEQPLDQSSFTIDEGEIQYLKEFHLEEIQQMIVQNPDDFAPTFRIALEEFVKKVKEK